MVDSKKQKKTLNVEFGMITSENVEQLRKINTCSFPIHYNEDFYKNIVVRFSKKKGDQQPASSNPNDVQLSFAEHEMLNKFAYWNGFVVGAICCRLEPIVVASENSNDNQPKSLSSPSKGSSSSTTYRLYIMTLAVLPAYRGRGIGSQLVQSVLDYCESHRPGAVVATPDSSVHSNKSKQKAPPSKMISEITLNVHVNNQDAIRFYTERFGFEQGDKIENYYRRVDPPDCYVLYKHWTDNESKEEETKASS